MLTEPPGQGPRHQREEPTVSTITVQDQYGDDIEVCGCCYSQPCCCQAIIDQGAGDWRPSAGDTARVISAPDPDPRCICGTARSEHALLGCRDGFILPDVWARQHAIISREALRSRS